MWKEERYGLDIVRLTSTYGLDSGTKLGTGPGSYSGLELPLVKDTGRAGMGLLIPPWSSTCTLKFTPVKDRVTSLLLQVGGHTHRTPAQSIQPSKRPWRGYRMGPLLGTPLFYWG